MSEAERPSPDAILARMKREETASARGKLKIFFGMSPGVGKTYAMLQAARQKQAEGCEVVIGIIETHGRKETEALLEGMPTVPLASSRQLTGEPGDAVLCHYQLGHGIAGNTSPHIRYAIYFRLKHVDHDAIHWECMTDIWREWAGMREVVGAAA